MAKTPLLSASLLIVGGLLVGCQAGPRQDPAPRPGEVVELDFWNGFSGPDSKTIEKMVKQFNEAHKGKIRVRMQIIPWGTYYDKVTLGLAFGGAPEVFVLHVNRFPEYASHGVLQPLDDLVQQNSIRPEEFVPAAWNATIWEGQQYAIPLDIHPIGLYYNVKLFREAGITKPPETYDEFIRAAKKLTKDKDGDGKVDQWGFSFTWLRSNSYTFLNQYDTSLLTPDLKRSALATPEAKDAMERMLQIVEKEKVAPYPEGQDAWMGFQTGRVAMALEGVYMKTGLDEQSDLDYAAAPVPQFGPKKAAWAGSHLLSIPKRIDPVRRDAAWTFIQYLSKNSLVWAGGGQVPARKALIESPQFRQMEVQYQFSRQIPYIVYEPPSVLFNQVATFGDAAVEAIVNRIRPPEEALKEASRRIDNVLERQ